MAAILVIEDNVDNRELMAYLLGAFGHEVTAAVDGQEGLAAFERASFDLVICDVHLPGMDGYQVLDAIKMRARAGAPPIIAVTALAMVGDRDRLIAAGFHGYVPKPIEPTTFVPEIEAFLDPVRSRAGGRQPGAGTATRGGC